jgi:hypothetical protein
LSAGGSAVSAREHDPAALRQRVIAQLNACARRLPEDVAMAARAALGLHPDAAEPRLQGRVAWLARRLGREERTALRRINEAETLLAEEIIRELERRRAYPAGDGWHVAWDRTLVRLDAPTMEAYEDRRIVADRDGLEEITLGLNLPCAPGSSGPDLHAEVRYGGRLIRHERPVPQRSQLVIGLPRPLAVGETCEVGIVTRLRPGHVARPHYVLTAVRPCRFFQVRVRFDPARPPRWVRRVSGEPVRMMDTPRPGRETLTLDAAGEICAQFDRPAMHLAYGVQWESSPAGR